MIEDTDFLFDTSGSTSACHERKQPAHYLIFSGGSPIAPLQLYKRQQRCLRLTVRTRLFWSPHPNTHYWYTRDMDWWFSAAKQVLDDLHLILTRQSPGDKSLLYNVSLRGPWRCGPWKSDATWLSRFIHRYCETEDTILYPFRNRVDKHLTDLPDTLRFDIFLLQCWSEMVLDPERRSTFETIYYLNEEAPEVCMETINGYMDRIGPNSEQGEQPEEPGANDPWIAHPAAHLDSWAELQPEQAREHQVMFRHYARHLNRECDLDLETGLLLTRDCPPECYESFVVRRVRARTNRLYSYIDYVIILAQRELGMVMGSSLASGPLASASSLGPATPNGEVDVDLLLDLH